MSQSDLVVVQSYATKLDAMFAQAALEFEGIEAMIQTDNAGGAQADSALGHRVLVRERDAAAARIRLASGVLLHKSATEIELHPKFCALLSAGISPTLAYDGTCYQLFVSEEKAAAARKVLEALADARP
jgi:hypothetical protein